MREAVATTTTFRYIFIFTLIFAAFIALTIVFNRVIRLKNESISIIEKREGINEETIGIINNFLAKNGYKTTGKCDDDEFGIKNFDEKIYEKADANTKYYYCLKSFCLGNNDNCVVNNENGSYNNIEIRYKIKLFYKFNLPLMGDLAVFKITGETKGINFYSYSQQLNEE